MKVPLLEGTALFFALLYRHNHHIFNILHPLTELFVYLDQVLDC